MKIVLASKSPRRKELLELMGIKNFETIESKAEEKLEEGKSIEEQSKNLAYVKAKTVFDKMNENCIVIGSDTLVIKNNKVYGKPKTKEEAFNMIKELQGAKHQVITSLCVLKKENENIHKYLDCDISTIKIKQMTEDEIKKWIDSGKAMDKAGAYAIQDSFAVYIEKIEGNYNSIMGLPISKLYDIIKEYI